MLSFAIDYLSANQGAIYLNDQVYKTVVVEMTL